MNSIKFFAFHLLAHTHIHTPRHSHIDYMYIHSLFRLFVVHFLIARTRLYTFYTLYAVCTVHVHPITGFAMIRRDELMKFLSSFVLFLLVGRLSLDCVSSAPPSTQQPLTPHIIASSMAFSVLILSVFHIQSPSFFLFAFTRQVRFAFKNPCANDCSLRLFFFLVNGTLSDFFCSSLLLLFYVRFMNSLYGIMCCN